jgi:hypothetical protein
MFLFLLFSFLEIENWILDILPPRWEAGLFLGGYNFYLIGTDSVVVFPSFSLMELIAKDSREGRIC